MRRRRLHFIQDTKSGKPIHFGLAQLTPYFLPSDIVQSLFCGMHLEFKYFYSDSSEEHDVFLTKIIRSQDPRADLPKMTEVKRVEIRELPKRKTFKIILLEEVPLKANILPGRFVLAIKSTEDGKLKYKARYVIGGHRDRMKEMMVHDAATLQPQSIRLILALSVAEGFEVWTSDETCGTNREGFRDKIISDIGFVRSSHNLADGLTKAMSQASFRDAVSTRYL
eukprot:IDg9468t1